MEAKLAVATCTLIALAAAPIESAEPALIPRHRIVGGVETEISQVPYQLALEWKGHQFCAASIISSLFAISAGHCIYRFKPEEIVIRTGSTTREAGGRIVRAKKFHINPKYMRTEIDYDVAVIELESPIEFDLNSQPISLTEEEPKPKEKVVVSGWGSLKERGSAPIRLHSIQINVIDRNLCKIYYRNVEEITERMICAGAPGYDSCKGDSGGPIVREQCLVGIVSWGRGCGRAKYPGVYTNLANPEIRAFIRNVTGI